MKSAKSKALRKKFLIEDEHEAIEGYRKRIPKAEGHEKKIYQHILPEEKRHIKELKTI